MRSELIEALHCTVLYCTVLYCTVLYGVGVGGTPHVVVEVQTQTQIQAPLIRQGSGDPRLE